MIQNTDLITAPWSVEGQPWDRFVGNLSGFAWIYTPVKRSVGFQATCNIMFFVCSFCFLFVFGSCIYLMMYVLYMIYDLHDVIFKDWHSDAFLVNYAVCRLLFSFFGSLISSGSWNSATCLGLVAVVAGDPQKHRTPLAVVLASCESVKIQTKGALYWWLKSR